MKHSISLSLTLGAFWLLNSGYNTPLILSLGVVSVAFVIYLAHRMDVVDHEYQPVHLTAKLPGYTSRAGDRIHARLRIPPRGIDRQTGLLEPRLAQPFGDPCGIGGIAE